MEETNTKQNNIKRPFNSSKQFGFNKRDSRNNRGQRSFEKPKPEFDQKMVSIRRVTRVVAGGRRMTFAVALAIGDKKGSIGLGTGKGGDTAIAISKALRQAKKSMFKIKLDKIGSIPHEISTKFSSARLTMIPNHGKGLVSGSTVREMLLLAGVKNVTTKLHSGTKNKLNNARAAYQALYAFRDKSVIDKKAVSNEPKEDIKEENK